MSDTVEIKRKIFGVNSFKNVVDTQFHQLIPKDNSSDSQTQATIDSFFTDYDSLFFQIPPSGSAQSHLTLINKSSDYLGISLQELKQEIDELRQENVSLKNQIFIITNYGSISK